MPRKVHCERCHRHVSVCGELSARKVCASCGEARIIAAIEQMRARRGPIFDRYRGGLTDYVANLYRGDIPSGLPMPDDAGELAERETGHRVLSS